MRAGVKPGLRLLLTLASGAVLRSSVSTAGAST